MANGGIALAQTMKNPSVRWLVVHLVDLDCILKSMLSKFPWKNLLKKPEVKENIIAEIPLSIVINLAVFLTETIDNQTISLDQKINKTNDQIQGKNIILIYGIKDYKARLLFNLLTILLFEDYQNGLKATIDDIACSIGSENSSPTLSSSPGTSGPRPIRSISSQLSKLIYFLYILCYI